MISDYKKITEDNIRKYGTNIEQYGPVLLANLYSDRTHFIYELLQNAEDAEATWVNFKLYKDRLEVTHNGKLFDEADVNGICGLVEGTKREDLTKIGKFGIGFKSVYAYTNSPKIYSGDEAFEIIHYVRPRAIDKIRIKANETSFIFPFNHSETEQVAFSEISHRLRELGTRTLLFLNNIGRINWDIQNSEAGIYQRYTKIIGDHKKKTIIASEVLGEKKRGEEWLIFERPIQDRENIHSGASNLKVEIAFKIKTDSENTTLPETIEPVNDSHLVVFFPTEKETHLKFLLQGPYRTTPARDNVPKDDSWNQNLINETTKLMFDVLPELKKMGLLNVNFLNILPISRGEFPENFMFRPMFDIVLSAFNSGAQLLPSTNKGKYISAKEALLARGRDMIDLLTSNQLTILFKTKESHWLNADITQDRTPDLRKYLIEELKIDEITPEKIATQFDEDFVKNQNDQWLIKFYSYLKEHKALWREKTGYSSAGPLRNKPFIRLENDLHVAPFDSSGKPLAYLSSTISSSFPTVKKNILKNEQAKGFLKELGLVEPDQISEILEFVLKKYQRDTTTIPHEENISDIQKIIKALETDSEKKKKDLLERLKVTSFLLAKSNIDSRLTYQKPSEIYFSAAYANNKDLEIYFEGYDEVYFLSENYMKLLNKEKAYDFLTSVGVADKPRKLALSPNLSYSEKKKLRGNTSFSNEYKHEDKDYDIEGLSHFLGNVNPSKAVILWKFLIQYLNQCHISSTFFKGTYHWFYYSKKSAHFEALFLKKLKSRDWIPDNNGNLRKPCDLSSDDLADDLEKESPEAKFLIEKLEFRKNLEQEYLSQIPEEERRKIEIIKKIPLQKLLELAAEEEQKEVRETLKYAEEFKNNFTKKQIKESEGIEIEKGLVPDPTTREKKTLQEIKEGKRKEPPHYERFKRMPVRIWEQKNSAVRAFLQEEYRGNCQICGYTFAKRNGEPYFEGLYLVSRTRAAWIDRPGNVLCLCANCCAKFEHGQVEADDILNEILEINISEDNNHHYYIKLMLCNENVKLKFSQRHLIDLQAILKADMEITDSEQP